MTEKQKKHRIPEDFVFIFFGGICSQERGFGGVLGIPVFSHFCRFFLQEFLRDRNSCISTGFLRISPDSSRFLQIPAGFLFLPKLSGSGWPTNYPPTSSPSSKPTTSSNTQALPSTPSTPPNLFYSVQYHVLLQLNLKPKT